MLKELDLKPEYLPSSTTSPELFFRQVISQSSHYQRAAGYFSSSIFELFRFEFMEYAKRGGKMQIVCSNQIAIEDYSVASRVEPNNEYGDIEDLLDRELERLEKEELGSNALSFFATLIRIGTLDIKVAGLKTGGIFHDKTGVFTDSYGYSVSFRGSSNETLMGWSRRGNFESLEVFRSWAPKDEERVENHTRYLAELWSDKIGGLEVSPLSDLSFEKIHQRSREDIDDFQLIFEERGGDHSNGLSKEKVGLKKHSKRVLNEFQLNTINNWRANNYKGIINHATGSGKTVTAISAIEEHANTGCPTVVVVPSRLLLRQWYTEILKDIPNATLLRCGDGHTRWRKRSLVRVSLQSNNDRKGTIVLTTSDTMSSRSFISQLGDLKNALVIADEVHTLGSQENRVILECNFGKRLGLSATPERYGDKDGTELIFRYFDNVLDPVITISDAIENKRLVNYVYFPIAVSLNEDEMTRWRELTARLIASGLTWGSSNKTNEKREAIKRLLIQRSRIAKKATEKTPTASKIIADNFQKGEYWLIYCEDMDQLHDLDQLLNDYGFLTHIYATGLDGSPEAELEEYIRQGGIMLSIRCLDEGIDIPRISHAVILASSQNPRQFIQRRGRVLRVDGVKTKAHIYDLFSLPSGNEGQIAQSLVEGELRRGAEFAKFALNKDTAMMTLRRFMIDLNMDPDQLEDVDELEEEKLEQ